MCGGMGIGVWSRVGGLSRYFREESKAECGELDKESLGFEIEDALDVDVTDIFEGSSVEEEECWRCVETWLVVAFLM